MDRRKRVETKQKCQTDRNKDRGIVEKRSLKGPVRQRKRNLNVPDYQFSRIKFGLKEVLSNYRIPVAVTLG